VFGWLQKQSCQPPSDAHERKFRSWWRNSWAADAATGQGTLTLITDNPNVGTNGTETFAVQFVNTDHTLIMQFDGTATSSGSINLQTLPSTLSGGYAFTISGVDPGYNPIAIGGVFSITARTSHRLTRLT
jgi:hypothetical protein